MFGIYRFLKSTTVGGLVILVPVIVLAGIIAWALDIALGFISPLFQWLPDKSVGGVSLTAAATLGGLIAICFCAGLVAETAIVRYLGERADRLALFVPGYALMKSVGASFIGIQSKHPVRTVLVRFEDSWQLGFLMDELRDGRRVVFIPIAPRALAGNLHIVAPDRVQVLTMSVSAALDAIGRIGVGLRDLSVQEPVSV
jgi:uncharacterized membrane protein